MSRYEQLSITEIHVESTDAPMPNASYLVADVPDATLHTGKTIFVSNGAAGLPVLAFSDGTDWLRCDTKVAVAAV